MASYKSRDGKRRANMGNPKGFSQGRVSETEGCQGKKTYASESRALSALQGLQLRREILQSDKVEKRAYACKYCFGYHTTSQASPEEQAALTKSLLDF